MRLRLLFRIELLWEKEFLGRHQFRVLQGPDLGLLVHLLLLLPAHELPLGFGLLHRNAGRFSGSPGIHPGIRCFRKLTPTLLDLRCGSMSWCLDSGLAIARAHALVRSACGLLELRLAHAVPAMLVLHRSDSPVCVPVRIGRFEDLVLHGLLCFHRDRCVLRTQHLRGDLAALSELR